MARRVLIVEDDPDVARLLAFNLGLAGFTTESAGTVARALERAGVEVPDVAVLDVGLPDGDGIALCQQLRQTAATRHIGVLMLTARGEPEDRIEGLEAGADDFVVKPFEVREVVARVRALAARVPSSGDPSVIRVGDVELDLRQREVRASGTAVALRPLEYRVLELLMRNPDRAFTRDEMIEAVWKIGRSANARMVDVTVSRLREALGKHGEIVETVLGRGYRLLRPR